jgi:sugar phosphate isomerase/epimerase
MILMACSLGLFAPCAAAQGLKNPFFPFDNGTVGREQKLTMEAQAELVKRIGYAGIGFSGAQPQRVPEMLQALESRGLKLFTIFVGLRIDAEKSSYDPRLGEVFRQLKRHGTLVCLAIGGSAPDAEARAVAQVREVADLAAASGLRVAIYPHTGNFVGSRVEDAVRIVQKVGRPNAGVTFNLAHFLAVRDEPNLDQRLKDALPYLYMVSINGADHEGGWDRLIQPLDRGTFDVYGLLGKLTVMGYTGPIALQCHQVPGDTEENLRRSMAAWRQFSARMSAEKAQ